MTDKEYFAHETAIVDEGLARELKSGIFRIS